MKKYRVLFFNLFFVASVCFSDELILPENVDKIVLERAKVIYMSGSKRINADGSPCPNSKSIYIPENNRKKRILEKKMNKQFINEINKLRLIDNKNEEFSEAFCHEIKLYNQGNLVAVFIAGRHYLVDVKDQFSYFYHSNDEEDILKKYWNISMFEDCFVHVESLCGVGTENEIRLQNGLK